MLFRRVIRKFKSTPTLKHDDLTTMDSRYIWELDNLLQIIDVMLNESTNSLVYTPNANYSYHNDPNFAYSFSWTILGP
jgi:hypothetical protein